MPRTKAKNEDAKTTPKDKPKPKKGGVARSAVIQESEIIRTEKPPIPPLVPENAALSTTMSEGLEKTEWFTKNGCTFLFRKVPPYAFTTSRANLRRTLRANRPEPPTVKSGNRQTVNRNDPYYLEQMALWESEWSDLQEDVFTTTAIFVGIKIKGKVLPPDEEWLEDVLDILDAMGIDEETIFTSFKFDRDKIKELLFKQYVILGNNHMAGLFNDFVVPESDNDEEGDDYTEAIDSFRAE